MMEWQRRRYLALAVVSGGVVFVGGMQWRLKRVRREQRVLLGVVAQSTRAGADGQKKERKVAVDRLFASRLASILRVCVPSFLSREAFYVFLQSGLLVCRTLLTGKSSTHHRIHDKVWVSAAAKNLVHARADRIAALEGVAGQSVVSKDWPVFADMLWNFAGTAVPAAFVNSGLKYMQSLISLGFRQRLTEHIHSRYLANRVYYVASTLGGLSNADQRITEDVDRFATSVSELFSYTFKPVLDIILFTRSLSQTIGYKGQFMLYGYFLLCSAFLRAISPPLALMTAQEAALSGNFRNAHQRLVAHAEEVAFNDPPGGDTERLILNDHLYRLLRHARLSAFQRLVQQVADGYMVKYAASIIGLCVYAAPIYFSSERANQKTLTGDYIRSMRLMMNTSTAIGQLVLIYKRVTSLAGVTSRVSELLESVKQLSTKEGQKRANIMKPAAVLEGSVEARKQAEAELPDTESPPPPRMLFGSNISGKSSLFRLLAELWPLQCGTITRPHRGDIFYLSQRPYVVRGSLRDQVRYPQLPVAIARATAKHYGHKRVSQTSDAADDERVSQALSATEIGYLMHRGDGLDQMQNWEETLSGGERQRLAIARVLYHRPKYAVLDECTSAVSADGEEHLYKLLQEAGITMLSIAHRPALKSYHQAILTFDGDRGWSYEKITRP
eukprot:SM000173S03025  [mRNA]  locus=s173:214507:219530:+ [translate_table: standard]